ncbi:hypothetical protein OUHCRE3_58330 [Enterobacter hormaechei]
MARINLLPWREELREQRKQQFLVILGGVLVASAALVFLGDQYFTAAIENQIKRLSQVTDAFAARRMDATVKAALSGRRLNEIEE